MQIENSLKAESQSICHVTVRLLKIYQLILTESNFDVVKQMKLRQLNLYNYLNPLRRI